MSTLTKPEVVPEPVAAQVTADTLRVDLADGRSITVPLLWFPRLRHGNEQERAKFELGRNGIHWPDLDEDVPVAGLLNGEKSGESLKSIERWLAGRKQSRRQVAAVSDLDAVVERISRASLYRDKHPLSQEMLMEVAKFVYATFRLLPEETASGHLLYRQGKFLHLETVAKSKPSLTINLAGKSGVYAKIPGLKSLLVPPRTGQTRLRITGSEDLASVFQAIKLAYQTTVK